MADTDEDLAEEDEVMSEGVVDVFSEMELEVEVLFRLPGDTVAALDGVNLVEEFDERVCLMKSDPKFLCGPYRSSMRVALEEINVDDAVRQERGWKLFLLLRLLLHRTPRSGTIPSQSCWFGMISSMLRSGWTFRSQGEPTDRLLSTWAPKIGRRDCEEGQQGRSVGAHGGGVFCQESVGRLLLHKGQKPLSTHPSK